MTAPWTRNLVTAICVLASAASVRAGEPSDFHAAVAHATVRYRAAMAALDTSGREATAAAVHEFRQAWQSIIDRYGSNGSAELANDGELAGMLMQVDMRLVGALIVIDIGSRDAARAALAPIQDTLSRLSARSAPISR